MLNDLINKYRQNPKKLFVVDGLGAAMTSAHFHNAVAGAAGGVIYDLSASFNLTGTSDGAFGYWTDLDATAAFMAANELMFRNDEVYVNVHTVANPSGEIRGQVLREGNCSNALTKTSNRQEIFEEVTLFPNPATDRMTLSMSTAVDFDGQLVISNTLGQTVHVENITQGTDLSNHSININSLQTGLYILTIRNEKYDYTIRFVKR